MRKLSIFAIFCLFTTGCFGAQSIRASSMPLTQPLNSTAQKTPVSVQQSNDSTDSDSGTSNIALNQTNNTSRASVFSSFTKYNAKRPLQQTTGITNSPTGTVTANTAKEMAELQKQIDDLLNQQSRLQNSLETQQTNLDNVVSDLQDKTAELESISGSVDDKINTKLVETGIVDNSGNLIVATKSEIEPTTIAEKIIENQTARETLSGKVGTDEAAVKELITSDLQERGIIDDTEKLKVATTAVVNELSAKAITTDNLDKKLAEKNVATTNDITADAIATKIVASETAQQKLAGKIGPDETAVKSLIVSDLKERNIIDNSGNLQIATSAAVAELQDKAITTDNLDATLTAKNVATTADITADKLATKLDSKFAKAAEITALQSRATSLETTAAKAITTDNLDDKLAEKNVATTADITADAIATKIAASETAQQKLAGKIGPDETAVKSLIVSDLKERNIIDNSGNLQIATSAAVAELQDKAITTDNLDATLAAKNVATTADITADKLATKLDSKFAKPTDITALQSRATSLETTAAKAITTDNLDDKLVELKVATKDDLPVLDDKTIASALGNSTVVSDAVDSALEKDTTIARKDDLNNLATKDDIKADTLAKTLEDEFVKPTEITALALRTTSLETTAAKAITDDNLGDKLAAKNVATTNDITADAIATKIAASETAQQKLAGKIGPDETAVRTLIADDLQNLKIVDGNGNLQVATKEIVSELQDKAITTDNLDAALAAKKVATTDDITADKLATTLDKKFAKPTDITALQSRATSLETTAAKAITTDNLDDKLVELNVATKDDLPVIDDKTIASALGSSTVVSDAVDSALEKDTTIARKADLGNFATKDEIAADTLAKTLEDEFVKPTEITTLALRTTSLETTAAKAITDDNLDDKLAEKKVATTADITADAIATKIAASETAQQKLSGKIGPDENAVKGLIASDLQTRNIIDNKGNLQIATSGAVSDLQTRTASLEATAAKAITTDNFDDKLAAKKVATTDDITADKLATTLDKKFAKPTDITALQSRATSLETTAAKAITTDNLDDKLVELNVATKDDLPVIDDKTIASALGSSTVVSDAVDSALEKDTTIARKADLGNFATKDEITADTLATTLGGKFAKPTEITADAIATKIAASETAQKTLSGKIGPDETAVKSLIVSDLKNRNIIDDTEKLKLATTAVVNELSAKAITTDNLDDKLDELNVATTADITADAIASRIAASTSAQKTLSGKIGPDETAVKSLIVSDLKNRNIIDNSGNLQIATSAAVAELQDKAITTDNLDATLTAKKVATTDDITADKLATTLDKKFAKPTDITTDALGSKLANTFAGKSTVDTLSSTVNKLNGDVTTEGSLLFNIKNDETIRKSLKGQDGKDGSGFTFKGNIDSYSELASKTKEQGFAYYNNGDSLLYICSCDANGQNCAYPSERNGVPFRGEKGEQGDKGDKGATGDVFTPLFDADTGKITWSRGSGSTTPSAMKIAKTDSELGTLVASKISADSTIAKKTDLTAEALGDTLKGTFAGKSTVDTLSGNVSTLRSTVTKLDGGDSVEGSIAYQLKNSGFAKNSDLTTLSNKVNGDVNTEGSLLYNIRNNSTIRTALKGDKGDTGATGATGSKGDKGDTGDVFTPLFDADTGKITWSRGSGSTTPSAMKIAKTDSELGTLVANKISADSTIAKKTDLSNFLTDNDLTATRLAGKLGSTYAKPSDLIGFAKDSDVSTLRSTVTKLDGDDSVEGSVAYKLKNSGFAKDSDVGTLRTNVGSLQTTVTKLDGADTVKGSIAYQLKNAGFAKDSDVSTLRSTVTKLDGDENTTGSVAYKLKNSGFAKNSDLTTLSNKVNGDVNTEGSLLYNIRNNSTIRTALKGDKGDTGATGATGSKGDKGDTGDVFTPLFDADTGKITWSRGSGSTTPSAMKIAKTDSELGTLVANKISADSTIAKKTDLSNFLTDNDLTATRLAGKLGSTYAKPSDLTGFAKDSDVSTLRTNVGSLQTTVTKLDGDENTTGSVAYKLKNSGFAKDSDLTTLSNKVNGDVNTEGSLLYNIRNNSTIRTALKGDTGAKGADGTDGISYIPQLSNDGTLTWKNSKTNADAGFTAINIRGPQGIKGDTGTAGKDGINGKTYVPSVDASGNLSWTFNSDGSTPNVTTRNIKGKDGTDGISYIPQLASDGTLTWKNSKTNADAGFTAINIRGPQGIKGDTGTAGKDGINGKTYVPSVDANGNLSWTFNSDGSTPNITARNIKGPQGDKGDTGDVFTPLFDADTGKITWSRGSGSTTPSAMKVAKTDSELGTLVANKISADSTIAKKTDLSNFLTDNDLTATRLAGKLGSTYAKPSDLTGFAKDSDVSTLRTNVGSLQTTVTKLDGDENTTGSVAYKLKNSGFAKDSDVSTLRTNVGSLQTTVTKLDGDENTTGSVAYKLKNSGFAKDSDVSTLRTNVGSLQTTVTKLDGDENTTGSVAYKLKNSGFAKDSDVSTLRSTVNKLDGGENTTGSVAYKLKNSGFAKDSDVSTLRTNVGSLQTTVTKLDGDENTTGSVAYKLKNSGFAKNSDLTTLSNKVNGDVNTEGSLLYNIRNNSTIRTALKGDKGDKGDTGATGSKGDKGDTGAPGAKGADGKVFRPVMDDNGNITFSESTDTSATSMNFSDGIRSILMGGGDTTKAAYGTANLEDAIRAIAAEVAMNVSTEVSKRVSKDISSQVSEKVAKRQVNAVSNQFVTPTKLTNLLTNGVSSSSEGTLTLNQNVGGTCTVNPVNPKQQTCSGGYTDPSVTALNDSTTLFNEDYATSDSALQNSINSVAISSDTLSDINAFALAGVTKTTNVSCAAGQYNKNGVCKTCPSGSTSNAGSTSCTCSNGFVWSSSESQCTCPDTKYINGSGACVNLPANSTKTTGGFSCNANYYKNSAGTACTSCGTDAFAPAGSTSSSACYCTNGATWSSNGCVLSQAQQRELCISHATTYWNGSSCLNVPENAVRNSDGLGFTCNSGYQKDGTKCITSKTICESAGHSWVNNQCITDSNMCYKQAGYTWDGSQCIVDSGGTAPVVDEETECASGGGQWIEDTCVNGQEDCEALKDKGYTYTWDEEKQRCVMGDGNYDNEESCKKSGYSWIDDQCITDKETCDKLGYTWNEKTNQCTQASGEGETYNDKESCTKAGYEWSDEYEVCIVYQEQDACKNAGYQWHEEKSVCITTENMCSNLGGKWNSEENKCDL